jgi:hypothetical protein
MLNLHQYFASKISKILELADLLSGIASWLLTLFLQQNNIIGVLAICRVSAMWKQVVLVQTYVSTDENLDARVAEEVHHRPPAWMDVESNQSIFYTFW